LESASVAQSYVFQLFLQKLLPHRYVIPQQIAAFVIPLLVIVGWITGHDLTLFFANFETIVLFVSVLLVNLLIQDGKSNYMEGLMLLALYFVVALSCGFLFISLPQIPRADWYPVWVS